MRLRLLLSVLILCGCANTVLAHYYRYTADLTGAAESPPNSSPAIGYAMISLDFVLVEMKVEATFTNLQGNVTAANIHAPTSVGFTGTADVATQVPTFDSFPSGVTSGSYSRVFQLFVDSTYNPAFITASGGTTSDALLELVQALDTHRAYFSIHTTAFGGGEIRGFLSHVEGDYNNNGVVDAADYVLWRKTSGNVGDALHTDANHDHVVNNDDYNIWRKRFGNDRTGTHQHHGSGATSAAAIPEPGSLLLIAIAGILVALVVRPRGARR